MGVVAGPEPSLDAPLCAFPRHAAAIQRVIDASADLVTAQVSGPGLVAGAGPPSMGEPSAIIIS